MSNFKNPDRAGEKEEERGRKEKSIGRQVELRFTTGSTYLRVQGARIVRT